MTGTITVSIIDDIPVAVADTNSVTEGASATGNVLTDNADTFGADGAEAAGGVVGVRASGGDTTTDASGSVGSTINGLYGTLTLNADGSYTYESTADAVTADAVDVFVYTIEDGDGDLSTTTLTIDVADVTLAPDNDALTVDEAALDAVGSNPTSTAETATGQLAVAGTGVTYVLDSSTDVYGTLTLNADGSYSYTLTAPFDTSPDADNGAQTENVVESYGYTATDADGNSVTGTITVSIIDDVPTATDNSADVAEGASVAGNVLTDDDGAGVDASGADGFGTPSTVTEIFSVGENTAQSALDASGNLVITTSLGVLTVDPTTGDYTYVSTANSTNADATDSFTYTIVDGDGDEATANLVIDVANAPGEISDNDVIVNEAGLDIGSDPTSTSEIDTDGQISVVGATGTLVYNLLSPVDGTYGTIALNSSTGEYTYTLDTPFTDTVTENGTNTVNGAESFNYEVRDSLGNLIGTGSIDVSIIDDIPTATDQASITVAEDAVGTIGGNVTTDGVADTEGADGATVTAITIGATTTSVPQDGSSASVTTANGVYTIDMAGNWTFDPNSNLDQSAGNIDASFSYTLTDGDGDFDTATQPIQIADGQIPQAGPDITLGLDDQNLADGSTPGATTVSDTIAFTEGSDSITSIVFGDVSALAGGLTWTRVSDTQITGEDGGRLVVTLDLSVAGTTATVAATLNDNYDDHSVINVDDLASLGDVDVVASDIEGDSASSTVSVTVSDDLPSITATAPAGDALTVDETVLGTDATADFSGLFTASFNADNPGTAATYALGVNAGSTGLVDTATNESVVLTVNAGVVEGRTSGTGELVFTVSVDAAGEVTLDQQRAVKHADTNDDNDAATLSAANLITLSATIIDSDGDTATATANIAGAMTFLDDGPDLSNVTLGSSVSVDETDGLATSATSAASILSFTSDFGEDGANGTAFTLTVTNANSGLATADGDFPITLVQTSATVITGVFNDGSSNQTAFTATINSDGTITLTQNVALEHEIDGDDSAGEHNDTLNLDGNISATVTITDGDGDSDAATLPVGGALTFFDDGPSVVLSGINDGLEVSDADFSADDTENFADNFTFDGGEDGAASTSFALSATNGTDSGLVDTATGNSVFLFVEAGEVVGREGADATSAASGAIAFTVSVDSAGNVELDQSRAVDHALSTGSDGSSVSLASDGLIQLIGTVTDNDGDTASQALDIGSNLTFTDDVPAAGENNIVQLDDDALGGNAGGTGDDADAANTTGTLDHDFGNDGGSIAFGTSGAPAGFQYVASGDDILIQQDQGSGFVTVVTVTLDPSNGDYTVTQNLNILHATGDAENNTEFTIGYTVTDGDTDTATSSLTINVDDDTPIAGDDSEIASVDDNASAENVGTVATLTGNDSYGADGAGVPAITIASGSLGGTVTIDGSGNLLYTSATNITAPFADQVESFTYTITDGDGDTTTATFDIRLTDEGPAINADAATFTVDEEGLGGIAGNGDDGGDVAGEVTVQSGTLAGIDFGTDGAGAIALTAVADTGLVTLAGNPVETVWDGTTLTGQDAVTGDDVFTLVITDVATGAYTFTLLAPVAHPTADTEDDQSFSVGVVVTDAEGESANGTISITIDDDSPIATDDTNALTEDTASVSGNVVTDTVADAFGADGAGDPEVTAVTGFGGAAGSVNGSTAGEFGSLTLNDDGSYTYNLTTSAVQGLDDGETETDTFTYTIVDADGDTSDATLTITINGANDGPVAVADTNWTIEDAASVITGNVLQTVPHNGAPDGNPRGDVVDTDVDGDTLTVTTTGTFNGTYGVLTLNSDGSYDYRLFTELENAAAFNAVQALDEGDAPLSDVFNYTADDGDASANSTLTIDIFGANDAPVVGTATVATSDEGLAGGLADTAGTSDTTDLATDSGTISITDSDDTAFTVTLGTPTQTLTVADGSAAGAVVAWSLSGDGKTLTGTINGGTVTAITLVIDDTGAFTVTQSLPIFHSDTSNEDVTSFTVDVSVNDGSATTTQTGAITVNLEDDSPVAAVSAAGLSVTHDETAGNDVDANDVTGPIAAFAGVTNTGDDPDVAGTVIGFAEDLTGLVATGSGLGGDSAGSVEYTLDVSSAGVDSGLDTTEGANIVLFKEGDVIVGRVGNQSGEAAFAVAVDSVTGAVSVVQYLSIEHPVGGTSSPDEAVSIASGALVATVTATDADGDSTSASTAIGDAISFEDDAGTLGAASPATQTIGNFANASGNGTFAYDTGSDGHGSFDITGPTLAGVTYTLDQNAVDITDDSVNNPIAGATLTATADSTGDTLFTISVDEDGNYEFTLVTPEAATTETISLLGLTAGGPTPFAETATGNVEFSSTTGGVNSSTVGFGVANQFVGAGEQFQVEFHSPGQPGDQAATTNPDLVTSAVLANDRDGGSVVYKITIFNDVTGQSEVVYNGLISSSTTLIQGITLTEFNRFEVEGVSGGGQGARFTSLDFSKTILPGDADLDFQVTATDGDGDVTSTSTVNVMVDASISAPASSSTMAFSTARVLLEDPIDPVSNDNDTGGEGGIGSGSGIDSLIALQETYRSDMRMAETTLVAAISGAVLIGQASQDSTGSAATAAGSVSYDAVPFDTVSMMTEFDGSGFEANVDLAGMINSDVEPNSGDLPWTSLPNDNPLSGSGEFSIGVQAEPAQIELAQFDSGFEGMSQSAFFEGTATGVDQAMEALLMMEPGTELTAVSPTGDPMAGRFGNSAEDVIADIAAEAAVDQMLEALTGGGEGPEYLIAQAGTIDMGLLNQSIEGSIGVTDPVDFMTSQMDEAAATVAAA
uniref:DUF5801 repeats-in-toxin domain-containing protein n=1 Tax=uncultured Erythrobacter sp. TaxID=263913 RepID=UPI002618B56D|nr:DUF5801 repeats-in-toxin domain-containing protein [uncultured Erythrobacter sp.]